MTITVVFLAKRLLRFPLMLALTAQTVMELWLMVAVLFVRFQVLVMLLWHQKLLFGTNFTRKLISCIANGRMSRSTSFIFKILPIPMTRLRSFGSAMSRLSMNLVLLVSILEQDRTVCLMRPSPI